MLMLIARQNRVSYPQAVSVLSYDWLGKLFFLSLNLLVLATKKTSPTSGLFQYEKTPRPQTFISDVVLKGVLRYYADL